MDILHTNLPGCSKSNTKKKVHRNNYVNNNKRTQINNLTLYLKSLSCVRLFETPWIIQSMEFSRQEYWSGLPFSSPGDLPYPGIEPWSPKLQADSLPSELPGKWPSW